MHIREETHYNLNRLHVIFAATSLLLLLMTIVWIVRDARRPWKRYQAEASRLLDRYTSDHPAAPGRPLPRNASGQARGIFGEIPPASWDGVIALRGIEIPGFDRHGTVRSRTPIDRCVTCHVLIDWSEGEIAPPSEDRRDFASVASREFPWKGVWEIPTGAVNLRRPVVSHSTTVQLWLPLVPQSPTGEVSASPGNGYPIEDALPTKAGVAATSPAAKAWERWGLAFVEPPPAGVSGAMVAGTAPRTPAALAELRPGDVILEIGDTAINTAADGLSALEEWLQRDHSGAPVEWLQSREFPTAAAPQRRVPWVRLTVRRGHPNPSAGHPRPDLYLSAESPHPLADFACTICHEGQGPATDFVHAAHFPKSVAQARQWQDEYSWHPEESSPYPMTVAPWLQRSCLACHRRVFDLAETGDPVRPAADRLLEGRRAFERFGCYGCHDVTDTDSPHPSDPDFLREPPYRGAASQLLTLDSLPQSVRQAAIVYLKGAEDDSLRQALATAVADWLATTPPDRRSAVENAADGSHDRAEETYESRFTHLEATRLLRVLTTHRRGDMIPPRGPSLRYVAQRRDLAYVTRYIANPTALRSDARMPRLFGLLEHVSPRHTEELRSYEDVEIAGMAAYLTAGPPSPEPTSEVDANRTPTRTLASHDDAVRAGGKRLFATQGCLACHRHPDFPDAQSTFGPDLDGLPSRWTSTAAAPRGNGDRSSPQLEALDGLTAWLDNPRAFSPHTRMPRPQFRSFHRLVDPGGETNPSAVMTDGDAAVAPSDFQGRDWDPSAFTDALASDARRQTILRALAAYLLSVPDSASAAGKDENSPDPNPSPSDAAIDAVFREYLEKQVPNELLAEAETQGLSDGTWDVVSPAAWADLRQITAPLDRAKKLRYIGRRALRRHGCHGCHDIPGLEDAGPIGPPLVNWGSKQPSQLAFDHILDYLRETPAGRKDTAALAQHEGLPLLMLAAKQREGWLYQKLVSPRSYDYRLDDAKGFLGRLRMGQWSFSDEERAALVTFVTGMRRPIIPPGLRPSTDPRTEVLARGRALIERLGCDQCHVLHHETWRIECEPKSLLQWRGNGGIDDDSITAGALHQSSPLDRRGLLTLDVVGSPQRNADGKIVTEEDDRGRPLYFFRLRRPALIEGAMWRVDGVPMPIAAPQITAKSPPTGGAFADLLYPILLRSATAEGITVGENEAWGWTPPSLAHIGAAVRGDWLRRYLLAPYPIRPNVPLAMPRYDLTNEQIDILAGYFEAIAQAPPERALPRAARLGEIARKRHARPNYLEQAFRILTDGKTYCGKCHTPDGRPTPGSASITAAPRLDAVADRLRPEYLRAWLSNPRAILPYTAMPALFPADGTPLDRSLMDASSGEQMEAVLDLLAVLSAYSAGRGEPHAPAEKAAP